MKIQRDDKEFLLCFFAGQAMQGLLASPDVDKLSIAAIVDDALNCAKALLKELESNHE